MRLHTFSTVPISPNRSQVPQHEQTCNIRWLIFSFRKEGKKRNFLAIGEKEKPELTLDIYCK